MTSGEKAFIGAVFGLTWLFVITYGGYNIGSSIMRHEWPKPFVIVAGVVFVLGVALVAFWAAMDRGSWRRNAQEHKKPAVRAEKPPEQEASPLVTYRGNSVYVQDRSKTPS